ncbi:protein TRANSPARENT TESTA 9-like isoform X2 [Hibiscus syriacus]|uniref:protein TRANSPARENT TESTA 9-like isoform X2 n=1 Tax=Hibiscus syriacus TaxID=106335 RepID=UPI0019207593|nr:protein TRANSPARENT TESTA 9-like isoform X2 [Hibiscus syriacus]
MWRLLWRSIDRFSLQHFKSVVTELRQIKVVDEQNRDAVVDLLQTIVEIVTYGDRKDPSIFEYEFTQDTSSNDVVVSFPLYSEALKFAQHEEKMIQTAIRALTLNIYNICDDNVYQFITTAPASIYFSDLVYSLREQCLQLDALVHSIEEKCTCKENKDIFLKTDKIIDNLYYFKDMLSVGESQLSRVVTKNLLSVLIFPLLLPLLKLGVNTGSYISAVTSLYIVVQLLQVVGGKHLINGVAGLLLYHYMALCQRDAIATNGDTAGGTGDSSPLLHVLNDIRIKISGPKAGGGEEININYLLQHSNEHTYSNSHYDVTPWDDDVHVDRFGIFAYLFSENHSISLASLFLLLTLAENKDLEHYPASLLRMSQNQGLTNCESAFAKVDGSILVRLMPQILKALLKVLACQPPVSPPIQWHTGWFLRKLLQCDGNMLTDDNVYLFNTSFEQSRECLRKELDGCWFDHIPDIIGHEWGSCKKALELQSQVMDPLFTLELASCQQTIDGSSNSYSAWQRMVDTVKVFILHLQLKAFIFMGRLLEKPSLKSWSYSDLGKTSSRDASSASFGSEVSLGSGIPCRIAFSYAGVRDVYLVAAAQGISGKLILAEKHPFRSQRGVVIAIAPLAGLSPKIDKDHPTWLHLRIREFDPDFFKAKGNQSKVSNPPADGRWTLGFHSAKACEAAQLLILEEPCKQRFSVERMLAPLLREDYWGEIWMAEAIKAPA